MADYEDTKVTDLVINNMSQEKFEELKAAGELDPTQIYLTPTEESGGASGDYLPLSGGTLSGPVGVSIGDINDYAYKTHPLFLLSWMFNDDFSSFDYTDVGFFAGANGLVLGKRGATTPLLEFAVNDDIIRPGKNYIPALVSGIDIGTSYNRFRSIAVGRIIAGINETTYEDNLIEIPNKAGTMALVEDIQGIVAVLPTAENGYTTVKNYGNGYVEITGYASIGTVGASTGSEVQIDLPAGYTMADANYWVNIAPTSETTMFDFKAEAKARSTTHFMVAYKNEDTATGLTAAGVYWEVRGMLATE